MTINPYEIYKRSELNLAARKSYGEVFTPDVLIEEMLDTLPAVVWKDPNLTWLDPAAGVGNFFAIAYNRLMEGLRDVIKNEKTRRKHILESMFFFVELQDKNIQAIQEIFNGTGTLKLNISHGDFELFTPEFFGKEHFDIVLGNPPYQHMHTHAQRKAKNHNLWSVFIKKGFALVRENGYLLYVTPPAWMSPSSKLLQQIFLKHQLHVVNIGECSKHFKGIGSSFSYYLIEKCPVYKPTRFIYEFKGGVNVRAQTGRSTYQLNQKIRFIPQIPTQESFSILEKTVFSSNHKLDVRYDSDLHRFTKKRLLSETRDEFYRFKVLHTPKQTVWSSRPHKTQDRIKVLIPLTTYFEQTLIDKCGNTQGMGYILCRSQKEAEHTRELLMTPLYRFIANITRWSNFNVPMVMQSLPLYPGTEVFNPESIYAYFGLNEKEIAQLEIVLNTNQNREVQRRGKSQKRQVSKLALNFSLV